MTNLDIAQAARLLPIEAIAERAGLGDDDFEPLGRTKAKLTYPAMARLAQNPRGKLILVTAMTPTPAGEGKTTTTVGLAQGLCRLGHRAIPATREPALGPIFGVKGGACGGGYSQVLPMEDINLFFTGDFPAVAAAHNLISALLDAHLHHGNGLSVDARHPVWPRTIDMNDRALREIVVGLGGRGNGYPRQDGFVVAPASEIMAILCLAESLADLKDRLGQMIVAFTRENRPIFGRDLGGMGAAAALMRDAIRPNLVQTIEKGPAFVHGGPFGNIAHGCSSVIATRCALGMADFVVTEAGFGSDLGAEKFMHLVAPRLGRSPDAIVLVVTARAVEHHGGGDLEKGFVNVEAHADHLKLYNRPIVVAINRFKNDTTEELTRLEALCQERGLTVVVCDPWMGGGAGCEELAARVASSAAGETVPALPPPYGTFDEKVTWLVQNVYGGADIEVYDAARRSVESLAKHGLGDLPVCMAKTQFSLSDEPKRLGRPRGFRLRVSQVRPSTGAGFLVAVAGEILLMPGLGKDPAAMRIDVDEAGRISGLF